MMDACCKSIFTILAFLLFCQAAKSDDIVISTDKGKIQGLRLPVPTSGSVSAFLGIPYAKPPLGLLRFRRPEPAEEWTEIRDATQYSDSCYQLPDTEYPGFPGAEMWNPNTRLSEDCLYLNVWTPSIAVNDNSLAPVMVWIYGGGFTSGTASLELYDGRFLSYTQQVVVVSMNYRVGPLGFLALPGSKNIKGNAGLFDQKLALSWIAKNIAAFGGDPSSVTLFGESAGAASVGHHLLSQGSRGLFTRAILQSGSSNAVWAAMESSQAWNHSLTLAQLLNCPTGPTADEVEVCLRTIQPDKIVGLQDSVIAESALLASPFLPTVDGEFLVDMPEILIQSGRFLKTQLLLGQNLNEGTYFLVYGVPGFGIANQSLINRDQFLSGLTYSLPGLNNLSREAAAFQYTDWDNEQCKQKNRDSLGWLVGDYYFSCPLMNFARTYVENGGSARMYLFDHRSSVNPWPTWMGVLHGDEIPFVFGIPLNSSIKVSPEEVSMSRRIMQHWSNFARNGDPSVDGSDWPQFTEENQLYVTLNTEPSQTRQMHRAQQCKFWDEFLPKLQHCERHNI